ncbi:flavin reductase family protein, partial [Couchioplanes caeruleus]
MDLDPARLGRLEAQQLLTGAVVPRPIAWVSTVSREGQPNLAPFSYFAPVCSEPMTLLFCPVAGPPPRPKKDTLSNVEAVGEFVINVAEQSTVAAVNQSSAAVPHGRSEFELAGVTPVPARRVRPPRVQEASIAFECRLRQIVRV